MGVELFTRNYKGVRGGNHLTAAGGLLNAVSHPLTLWPFEAHSLEVVFCLLGALLVYNVTYRSGRVCNVTYRSGRVYNVTYRSGRVQYASELPYTNNPLSGPQHTNNPLSGPQHNVFV
jgi:hypothetical protein